ncbi:uncharacterized protein LTR77_010566 [Saxophila tyrrhenica]|uniref:Major facilitator superfamily (MFS) profile domain-containing protein n=1 Tax=Saxophila tyrrhenica TaxID=1690608 RepID=A0AAV9NVE2_9PEZI|nr:hypothetical protein LTR77_010566 [Saxophila tyrrhenica]
MDSSKEDVKTEFVDERAQQPDEIYDNDHEDPRIKRIKRKVDLRLSLILAVMYCVNQIDRTNLGNASIAGMDVDLNLIGNRYQIIVLVFFPFYILGNPIATVLARKLGPRPFLAAITAAFGLVVVGMGLSDNWQTLMGLRMLLGIFESCFFPSAIFLVSMWYLRREVAKRNAFFYLIGNSVGGFGGVLAFGLQQMDGIAGHEGWRWIFIWEGIITAIIAIIGFIFLVDFPEEAHKSKFFLTDEEIKLMVDRVDRDRGDAHVTEFSIWKYLSEAKDWKCWCFAVRTLRAKSYKMFTDGTTYLQANFGFAGLVTYSVSYFLPIILRESLGFSVALSQCLTAPCYVFSFLLGFAEAVVSDKTNWRGHIIVFNSVLMIIGANSNVTASMTYQQNNVVGQWKRAFTSANMVAMGGVGGIIGGSVFRGQDAPQYVPGLITCFLAAGLTILSVMATTIYMINQNRKQAKGQIVIEGVPGFRYTI